MLLHERDYSACGVREITDAAGAPLGSFTSHFRSKEEFSTLVLDRYLGVRLAIGAQTLGDGSCVPLDRNVGYFEGGKGEVRPGLANVLHAMSRVAPRFHARSDGEDVGCKEMMVYRPATMIGSARDHRPFLAHTPRDRTMVRAHTD